MRLNRLFLVLISLVTLAACNRSTGEAPPDGILFQDDFEIDSGRWLLESDLDATATYVEGRLELAISTPNLIAWSELQETKFDDFVLQVDATQVAGPDNNSYGVVFRIKSPSEYYIFDISGDGYYRFWRRDKVEGGRWVEIITEWVESPAIHRGASTNMIKVVAQKDHFTFYVNDQQVAEAVDDTYRSGTIGLDGGSFHEPGVVVAFDNVIVTDPE